MHPQSGCIYNFRHNGTYAPIQGSGVRDKRWRHTRSLDNRG